MKIHFDSISIEILLLNPNNSERNIKKKQKKKRKVHCFFFFCFLKVGFPNEEIAIHGPINIPKRYHLHFFFTSSINLQIE